MKSTKQYRNHFKNKKILNRDREVLIALSKVHKMHRDHLDKMKFSKASMNRFIKTGIIEKVTYFDKHNQMDKTYYKLTEYGEGWCRRNEIADNFYKSNGINHDLRIADVYTNLIELHGYEGFTWKTEKEILQEFYRKMELIKAQEPGRYIQLQEQVFSAPDFAYIIDEIVEYVEVITGSGSYTESHIEAKISMTKVLNQQECQIIR